MKRILAVPLAVLFLCSARPAGAQTMTTDALLDTLQHTAFNYFWNEANPLNGLIKDRSTSDSPCSIASTGFGLSGICVGVDRGWVSRSAAAARVLTTLQTFWNGPQSSIGDGTIGYKGFFYHFLDMNTGLRTWSSELSSIDTALLLAGILDAKQYFDGSDPNEQQIRALADSINQRVDWNFMRNFNQGVLMGWKPGTGFAGFGQWIGYNEAMILYILALGSPTHAVPTNAWARWTSGYVWGSWYGYDFVQFPPLFGHQYSHCWVDFRSIRDAYMTSQSSTYYENTRRATLAQRAYCIANPGGFVGYGTDLWGLTAGDGPSGYNARGAPPAQNDDGTIAPTAAITSLIFAPDEVWPVIYNLWNRYRAQMFGPYGFTDGLNPGQNWFDTDVLGIDQGPILLMLENYRTGSIWQRFMRNAEIQNGLTRAGFTQLTVEVPVAGVSGLEFAASPNPSRGGTRLRFRLPAEGAVRLSVFDVAGREIARPIAAWLPAGERILTLNDAGWPAGLYVYRLEANGMTRTVRGVRLP
ncbi:MAG TPA: glucoamylase family protein [Candidatus Sulfotelmatobacter sp.]|nr:glucoamylase family protein [Candidatus Sulfotelmatobacter sp.]